MQMASRKSYFTLYVQLVCCTVRNKTIMYNVYHETPTHIHKHTHTHIYIYIYMCVCVYLDIERSLVDTW